MYYHKAKKIIAGNCFFSKWRVSIFQERYPVLQEILKIWKLGKAVSISCLNDEDNTLEPDSNKYTEHLKEGKKVTNEHSDFMEQDEISNVNTSDDLASRNLASMTEEEASIEPASKKEKMQTSMSSPDNIKTKKNTH